MNCHWCDGRGWGWRGTHREVLAMKNTVRIRFIPQEWYHDCAINVDAPGSCEFDVPKVDAVNSRNEWLRDHSNASDALKYHKNAPQWIRDWTGPFEIEILHEDNEP